MLIRAFIIVPFLEGWEEEGVTERALLYPFIASMSGMYLYYPDRNAAGLTVAGTITGTGTLVATGVIGAVGGAALYAGISALLKRKKKPETV